MLLCNLVMAAGTWPFLDRRDALTAGYCSGGRHNALLMAVLPASADADIFLFIAAVQFPLYLMPTLLEPHLPPPAAALTHRGGSGHFFCGPRTVSNQREIRITPRSSKRRPAICTPIGLPSLV